MRSSTWSSNPGCSLPAQPSIAISGNRMRYGRDRDIVIDDAWKEDLDRADRVKFALLGGVINRFQGYKWTLKIGKRPGAGAD